MQISFKSDSLVQSMKWAILLLLPFLLIWVSNNSENSQFKGLVFEKSHQPFESNQGQDRNHDPFEIPNFEYEENECDEDLSNLLFSNGKVRIFTSQQKATNLNRAQFKTFLYISRSERGPPNKLKT